jgi:hypothetical protein
MWRYRCADGFVLQQIRAPWHVADVKQNTFDVNLRVKCSCHELPVSTEHEPPGRLMLMHVFQFQ